MALDPAATFQLSVLPWAHFLSFLAVAFLSNSILVLRWQANFIHIMFNLIRQNVIIWIN